MALISCEINIFLTFSEKCIIVTEDYGSNVDNESKFIISDTKTYGSAMTLSTRDKENLYMKSYTG